MAEHQVMSDWYRHHSYSRDFVSHTATISGRALRPWGQVKSSLGALLRNNTAKLNYQSTTYPLRQLLLTRCSCYFLLLTYRLLLLRYRH